MFQDLGLNLISEVIGIAITVFLVDRLIARREEQRWRPAKENLYYNLFWSLTSIIHFLRLGSKWREEKFYRYNFGFYYITTHYDVKKLNSQEIEYNGIGPFAITELKNVLDNITENINRFPQLIEPDLLSDLLKLIERLEPVIRILDRNSITPENYKIFNKDVCLLAEIVFRVLVWLSKKDK